MMRLRWLALLMVSVFTLSACSSSSGNGGSGGGTKDTGSKEPIKVGLAMALTGSGALTGEVAANGTRLAVQHINAAGGINGRPIQLLEEDISDNNTAAVNALNRLVANGAVAIVGPTTSNPSAAMVPIVVKEQIPTLFRGITVDLKPTNGWAFRFAPHGQWQTAAMVRYLVEEKGYKKIAILHLNDEYGKSTSADAIKALKSLNLDPVVVEQWSGTDKDFTPQLTKVRNANPDAIIQLGVGATVPQMVKQRYAMGLKQPFMTTTVITNQKTLELFTDEEVSGVYVVLEGVYQGSTTAKATKFREDFKAKYKLDADANAAIHYDGTLMLAEALKKAGSTENKAIRDALQKIQNFEGTTCTYNMAADGESCFQYAVYQYNKKVPEVRKAYDFGKK